LQIGWDIAEAFVICAALTVLLPDFINVSSDSNQKFGGPFCHFGYFFFL
jgi:hypothetical protein